MTQSQGLPIASPHFKANPYPFFAQIRAADPVHQVTLPGNQTAWLITRYTDADAVLRDQRFVKDARQVLSPENLPQQHSGGQEPVGSELTSTNRHLLTLDPPDHTRLRTLVSLSFTPRLI